MTRFFADTFYFLALLNRDNGVHAAMAPAACGSEDIHTVADHGLGLERIRVAIIRRRGVRDFNQMRWARPEEGCEVSERMDIEHHVSGLRWRFTTSLNLSSHALASSAAGRRREGGILFPAASSRHQANMYKSTSNLSRKRSMSALDGKDLLFSMSESWTLVIPSS